MEKDRGKNFKGCAEPETIVSYLYGELATGAVERFEDHLTICDECTAELAGISFSRLDVYEWKRDEFEQLQTPPIVVPIDGKAHVTSWIDVLRAIFSPIQFATAGGMAILAIVTGLWFLSSEGPVLVATNSLAERTASSAREVYGSPEVAIPEVASEPKAVETFTDPELVVVNAEKIVRPQPRSSTARSTGPTKARSTSNTTAYRVENSSPRPITLRLNDFDDDDDVTLRLADLLADVDTRD
ncbi:MAG TPA: zf-HC2 domain-containing protein [Pyrinomonadaceae bacterium]|nr:zf-HC2 domain-containing protein [Pyrinomonadaceae bacterium]